MAGGFSTEALGLFALGAVHGINPGMGWLFAVARGFQERDRRAVWRAMGPLAVGHGLAIAAALAGAALVGVVVPQLLLHRLVGVALAASGVAALFRHRHPRGGGMRLGARALTGWSFLMATAHGAGLMALPLVLGSQALPGSVETHRHGTALMAGGPNLQLASLIATAAHSAGYLLVTAVIAIVVYERVGIRMLRSAWINFDLFWALALIIAGAFTLVA